VIVYRFLPETARRREQAAKVAALTDQVEKQKQMLARAKREAELLTRDPAFVELIARDKLDLIKEGEKVYRLEQEPPAAPKSAKPKGSK
jgi:cell division protein FtsB